MGRAPINRYGSELSTRRWRVSSSFQSKTLPDCSNSIRMPNTVAFSTTYKAKESATIPLVSLSAAPHV